MLTNLPTNQTTSLPTYLPHTRSWLGFNCGSNLAIATPLDAAIVSRVAVNTALAGGAGGIALLIFRHWRSGHMEVLYTCNGVLAVSFVCRRNRQVLLLCLQGVCQLFY